MLLILTLAMAQPEDALSPATCDTGEATAEQRAALADFDFLIGDFSVTAHQWMGDQWSESRSNIAPSRWNGRYGMGGRAIVDDWWDEDPGLKPEASAGTNVRIKKPDGRWVMSWVSQHQYGVQHLEARRLENGDVEMVQVYPERKGFVATFQRLGPDRWARFHHALDAEGNPLPPIMLLAKRIPCAEDPA